MLSPKQPSPFRGASRPISYCEASAFGPPDMDQDDMVFSSFVAIWGKKIENHAGGCFPAYGAWGISDRFPPGTNRATPVGGAQHLHLRAFFSPLQSTNSI